MLLVGGDKIAWKSFHANFFQGLYFSTQIWKCVYIFPRKLKSGSIFFHANSKGGIYFSTQIEKWIYIFPRKYKYWSIFFHANMEVGLYFSTQIEKWIYKIPRKFKSGSIFSISTQFCTLSCSSYRTRRADSKYIH